MEDFSEVQQWLRDLTELFMSPLGRLIPGKIVSKEYLGGISRFALANMHKRGEGPPRIWIGREWFYPEKPLQEWLVNRLDRPLTSQPAE